MTALKAGQIHKLSPSKLSRDPLQPRDPESISKTALKELSVSLKSHGMLQPIVIRQEGKKIIIVYGERRWRAAKLAKLRTVPCVVGEKKDLLERAAGQIAENVDREGLNTVDIAAFLLRLQKKEKQTVNELAAALAKRGLQNVSHTRIANLLKINELPAWAKTMLRKEQMTEKIATRLLPCLKYPKVMAELHADMKRDVEWTGMVGERDLDRTINGAYRSAGRDLKKTWGDDQPVFNVATVCKGCEFRQKVGANGAYCMAPADFDKRNADAKLAKKEREVRKAAKGKAAGGDDTKLSASEVKQKAKRKVVLYEEKLSNWMDGWLRPRVLACVADRATGMQIYSLTYWLATGAVKKANEWSSGQLTAGSGEGVREHTRGLLHHAKIGDLQACLGYAMCGDHKAEREDGIARAAVSVMDAEQLRWFARVVLQYDLLKEGFAIDIKYLDLHRKAELIELAKIGGVVPRGTGGVPLLKQDILATLDSVKKIAVPKALADLYARDPEPIPDKVFKRAAPTAHDQLIHDLGLDSGATVGEIVHALHTETEATAAKAASEAQKVADEKAAARKKKAAKKKPVKKRTAKKKVAKKKARKKVAKKTMTRSLAILTD